MLWLFGNMQSGVNISSPKIFTKIILKLLESPRFLFKYGGQIREDIFKFELLIKDEIIAVTIIITQCHLGYIYTFYFKKSVLAKL